SEDGYDDPLSDLHLADDPLTSTRYSLAGGNPVGYIEDDGHDDWGADAQARGCTRICSRQGNPRKVYEVNHRVMSSQSQAARTSTASSTSALSLGKSAGGLLGDEGGRHGERLEPFAIPKFKEGYGGLEGNGRQGEELIPMPSPGGGFGGGIILDPEPGNGGKHTTDEPGFDVGDLLGGRHGILNNDSGQGDTGGSKPGEDPSDKVRGRPIPPGYPDEGFEQTGGSEGNWYNKDTEEWWRRDIAGGKHGPHWDYGSGEGKGWRVYPDGRLEPKGSNPGPPPFPFGPEA
ncbi:MAG: Bacterial toxin 37, partial [Thermoleophilaceae bacterium]|nr:Bacterial toxin 37 [Thermoleophilaceae bacterium]